MELKLQRTPMARDIARPPTSLSWCWVVRTWAWVMLVAALVQPSLAMRVQRVRVPKLGLVGQPASLECDWEPGRDFFYSIRWYKDDALFYSFIPKNIPSQVNHDLPGLSVELSESDEHVVRLRKVELESEGVYICEVIGEAPTFKAAFKSTNFTVAATPTAVELSGAEGRQVVHSRLNVTCTAWNAWPRPALSFTLDGAPVQAHQGVVVANPGGRWKEEEVEGTPRTLYNSTSLLTLTITPDLSPSFELGCRASVRGLDTFTRARVEVEPSAGVFVSPATPVIFLLLSCLPHLLLASS